MALISQMYGIGGGGSDNTSLPTPPAKAPRSTNDVAASLTTGLTSGSNGRYKFSYQFWDVSSVTGLASHSFGIGSGDAAWNSSLGMALRNDVTGTTVWTKAYSTLGDTGPQGVVMDIVNGFAWVFVGNTPTTSLRLWRITLSNGTAVKVADAPVTGYRLDNLIYASTPTIMFARFNNTPNTIEFVFWDKLSTTLKARVCTVNISTGSYGTPSIIVPWGTTLGGEDYVEQSKTGTTPVATVQYITKDKRAAISFTPSDLIDASALGSSTNGGNRGAIRTVIIYRGFGRAVLSIANDMYHIPYRADNMTISSGDVEQVFVTDNMGAIANVKSKTQYVPAWDGRFDFYNVDDLDRWIHEIADNAGLPSGTAMW